MLSLIFMILVVNEEQFRKAATQETQKYMYICQSIFVYLLVAWKRLPKLPDPLHIRHFIYSFLKLLMWRLNKDFLLIHHYFYMYVYISVYVCYVVNMNMFLLWHFGQTSRRIAWWKAITWTPATPEAILVLCRQGLGLFNPGILTHSVQHSAGNFTPVFCICKNLNNWWCLMYCVLLSDYSLSFHTLFLPIL